LCEGEPGVGLIDPDENVAFLHGLRVGNQHLADGAANRRRHLGDFDGRIGVVGRYEFRTVQEPVRGGADEADDDDATEPDQQLLAALFLVERSGNWRIAF